MDEWRSRASCLGADPSSWFPDDDDDDTTALEAKRICATCPVIRPCLYYSIRHSIRHGIWGGMGRDRRLRLAGIYHTAQRAGDWVPLEEAVGAELDDLARLVSGWPDDRPESPARSCERCGEMVPAGRWPVDRNGPNATCGRPSTYNKGCRCVACMGAKADYDQVQKRRRRQRDRAVAEGYTGGTPGSGSSGVDPSPGDLDDKQGDDRDGDD